MGSIPIINLLFPMIGSGLEGSVCSVFKHRLTSVYLLCTILAIIK
jgi:hypothetical protein